MVIRKITDYSDIPERYFIGKQPPTYRGSIVMSQLVKKPSDPSKIKPFICIKKPGRQGNRKEDWESVIVQLNFVSPAMIIPPIGDALIDKRNRLLRTKAANFHYLEETSVSSLYESLFASPITNPEPVINELAIEIEEATQSNTQIDFPALFEEVLSREKVDRLFDKISFKGLSPSQKFIQFQAKMIEDGKALIDLEFKGEKSIELAKFDNLIRELSNYEIQVDEDQVLRKRKSLEEEVVEGLFNSIRDSVNQEVVISADFKIYDNGNNFQLRYELPISKVIGKKIEVLVPIPKEGMIANWLPIYEHSIGRTVRSNIYGTVFRSDMQGEGYWEIAMNPIAVYS